MGITGDELRILLREMERENEAGSQRSEVGSLKFENPNSPRLKRSYL